MVRVPTSSAWLTWSSVALFATLLTQPAAGLSTGPTLLLFTATAGFRHDSIPTAVETITALGLGSLLSNSAATTTTGPQTWITVHTEDGSLFDNPTYLSQFAAVAFVHTTDVDPPGKGTVLSPAGANNLGKFILDGGNFVGIHSAANTLYDYPFYGRLVGAFFDYHAQAQPIVSP